MEKGEVHCLPVDWKITNIRHAAVERLHILLRSNNLFIKKTGKRFHNKCHCNIGVRLHALIPNHSRMFRTGISQLISNTSHDFRCCVHCYILLYLYCIYFTILYIYFFCKHIFFHFYFLYFIVSRSVIHTNKAIYENWIVKKEAGSVPSSWNLGRSGPGDSLRSYAHMFQA